MRKKKPVAAPWVANDGLSAVLTVLVMVGHVTEAEADGVAAYLNEWPPTNDWRELHDQINVALTVYRGERGTHD